MESTVNLPVVGMDIAKNVFQLHVVDTKTGEVQRHKLKRDHVAAFFANHERSLVAMEACGGAHHWSRTLWPCPISPDTSDGMMMPGEKDDDTQQKNFH